jgi:signal transduction histidine kinase
MPSPRNSKLLAAGAALASLAAITWADVATGYELGLFVFYFLPVAMAAWWLSRRAGIAFAVAAGGCWLLADRLSSTPYSHSVYLYWETAMHLVSYLVVALALSQIRTVVQRQQDLLRVVSHDLRSPLTALIGQAQLLEANAAPGSPVAGRTEAILRVGRRMASMIEDLVDAARFESRRLVLDVREVEVTPFLGELLRRMSTVLPRERVELRLPPEPAAVRADPARLERIVVNLLSNALRYSPGPVQVEVRPAGARVVLAVIDHGPGIAAADRRHLFERYYRGSASRGTSGVGLGLYSTQLLVRAHGGRIRVEESRGGGATFLVELPAPDPPPDRGADAARRRAAGR